MRRHVRLDSRLGHHLLQIRAHLPEPPSPLRFPPVLAALARSMPEARVLQIGANDGDAYDPLRHHLRARQWHAWLLEPVPDVHARLVANTRFLPRVHAINLAIGPIDGWMPFYRLRPAAPGEEVPAWYDKVGCFDRELLLGLEHLLPGLAERIVETQVECVTIPTLFGRFPIGTPDLVHIDAEGFDAEVIGQLDDADLLPGVLLYEHAHLGRDEATTATRLRDRGYRLTREGMDTLAVHGRLLTDPTSTLSVAFRRATT